MDYILRCNSTKCRVQLVDRAVVTTCSHVFCLQCSDSLGLSSPAGPARMCPACNQQLSNQDDAMVQALNLSEEQKSTVLSGLQPSTIMECAGRAVGFYSYQAMQEILYQEYSGKHLTDRYTGLKSDTDRLVQEANTELTSLTEKLNSMRIEKASLEDKNRELMNAFREKSKALQNTQRMYQGLKAQMMASHTEHAAAEDAENTLNNMTSPHFEQIGLPKPSRGPFSQLPESLPSRLGPSRGITPLQNMLHSRNQQFHRLVGTPSQRTTSPIQNMRQPRTLNHTGQAVHRSPLSSINANTLSNFNFQGGAGEAKKGLPQLNRPMQRFGPAQGGSTFSY